MLETLLQDVRYAVRALARRPGFTMAAVLSLGLGIGANSTIFTLVNAAFLQALPVEEPDRVVAIYGTLEGQPGLLPLSHPNFEDLERQAEAFSDLAAFHWLRLNLMEGDRPERLFGQIVSARYFETLRLRPQAGRLFGPADFVSRGGHPVAVLSHRYWNVRFGGDPGVVGREVLLNGRKFRIVGITPRGFKGVNTFALNGPDIFVPMSMSDQLSQFAPLFEDRSFRMLGLIGRLRPGVTHPQAAAELRTVMRRLEQEFPDVNQGQEALLVPLAQAVIMPQMRQSFVRAGVLLTAVAGLLLLIACANVASLLLTRGMERRREIAIRLTQGARRGRLARQLLTESLVLALLGGGFGLLLAAAGPGLLWRFRPPFLTATAIDLRMDGRIVLFTLGVSLLTGLLFGLAPALQALRADLVPALKDQNALLDRSGRRLPWRNVLIAGQVALALVALIGAGLFLGSLRNAQAIDPGFDARTLITVGINVGAQGYGQEQGRDLFRRMLARLEALPGVRAASLSANQPLNRGAIYRRAVPEGDEAVPLHERPYTRTDTVGPRYFETLGIPILQGRGFTGADREDGPLVAIVNRTMAERLWPGQSPVGRRFRTPEEGDLVYEVVGMAADAKYVTLSEPPEPLFYLPHGQAYVPEVTLYVRTAGAPRALLETVRREVQSHDRTLPLADLQPLGDALASSLWAPRMGAALLSLFGLLALVLASAGIYGVTAYSLSQRRREVGIRMALGARREDVLALILRQALLVIGAGLAVGLGAAAAGSRLVASLLYGISGTDPGTFAAVTLFLAAVALLASYLAARRSTRVSPVISLRGD